MRSIDLPAPQTVGLSRAFPSFYPPDPRHPRLKNFLRRRLS